MTKLPSDELALLVGRIKRGELIPPMEYPRLVQAIEWLLTLHARDISRENACMDQIKHSIQVLDGLINYTNEQYTSGMLTTLRDRLHDFYFERHEEQE